MGIFKDPGDPMEVPGILKDLKTRRASRSWKMARKVE